MGKRCKVWKTIIPETLEKSSLLDIPQLKQSAEKQCHNYSDFCECRELNFSDHSPVYATFVVNVPQYMDFREILCKDPLYEGKFDDKGHNFNKLMIP